MNRIGLIGVMTVLAGISGAAQSAVPSEKSVVARPAPAATPSAAAAKPVLPAKPVAAEKPAATTKPAAAAGPAARPQAPAKAAETSGPGTKAAPAGPAEEANPAAAVGETAGFTYNPQGRRDPFVSLARRGSDTRSKGPRPAGLAGLEVGEVMLRGTLRTREGFVAMLQGSDQKTYTVRPGDKLFDGTVSRISQTDLVIVQQVDDPLSREKQREVRKGLRQVEAN